VRHAMMEMVINCKEKSP